jgi:glutamine synthetase
MIAEYIWIGGNNEVRSKTKVLTGDTIPEWNYDGSSTEQASGFDSEVILKPVFNCKCPFRRNNNILVFCDTFSANGQPLSNRVKANEIFNKNKEEDPWFGIEQEFFLINPLTNRPLGFPDDREPNPQGQYYCSIGAANAFGRKILEEHLEACLYAGIKISGINAEVAPGQWEYQIGPCSGINSGDQVWVSRYILERIAENHGVSVSFHPKFLSGDWNGSGCHTNYSTKSTREGKGNKTGLEVIREHINKLEKKHSEHMKVYGIDNNLRMTGKHETASYETFSWGVANRGASIRIGNETMKNRCGYYEDRRPASNIDPYLVTSKLFETTVL